MKRNGREKLIRALTFALLIAAAAALLTLTGCKKAEAPEPERETVRVFSRLLPENELFYSEDGGVWGLDHHENRREGGPERVAAVRYGPVFLPETTDVGETLKLRITGIHKANPEYAKQPEWWYLDYSYETADNKPKAPFLSLQILLDGQWYLLPSGGLTPEWTPAEPDSLNLMKGRLYPEETEQITPGHYRLVLFRDWRGEISLDALEFDLVETDGGYVVDNVTKPADLFGEKVFIPDKNILRQDGSGWRMAEASRLEWWDFQPDTSRTDTLEALESAGSQKPAEPDGVPPSPEMTPPPSAPAAERTDEENAGVSLTVTEMRKDACVFELINEADVPFSITKDYALERWEKDAWRPCEVLRGPGMAVYSYEVPAGETGRFVYDWSYPYGTLAPGRYRLTVWGNSGEPVWHQGSLTAEFELTGDEAAIEPAPAPAPWPDWAEAALTMVTPHKWQLCLSAEPERKLRWEDGYTLFRKEGEDYVPVSAAYRLPGERHISRIGERTWNINLAAAYGELPPGEYLLRKRLADLSIWPEERDRDWDLIEPEKVILLDVPFTLEEELPDVSRETDPYDWLLYVPSLPVEERILIRWDDLSPAGVRLVLENTGEEGLITGYNWYLYFLEGEEWFPVPTRITGYSNIGLTLLPGGTQTQEIGFEAGWGLLPPGVYRLVQELNDGKQIFCEFEIRF